MEEGTKSWELLVTTGKRSVRVYRRLVHRLPKEKFVRRKEKIILLHNERIGCHPIPDSIPHRIVKREIRRSWLGDGIQQDDIHCESTDVVEHIEYDKLKLDVFVMEILSGYSAAPNS